MRPSKVLQCCALACLPLFLAPATRSEQLRSAGQGMPPPTAGREWTQGGREGWFFYREIVEPDPEEEERRPEPAPQAIIPPPSPQPPPPGPQPEPAPAVSGPAPLSAAWFRERLEGYRDQAIDDPSPENVQAYLYLQRIMLDKTSRFTESYQQVVATNPDLDANAERPLAPFAASQVDRMAAQAQDALLQHIAQDTGILFVYRSDCVYCEQQAPILQMLERTHGLKILAVALDGKPMPNGAFPNFTRDAGQAAVLGVQRTPSLFLLRPPGDVVPVSQGVLALQALKERILGQARIAGWISEEAWQATRQVQSRSLANLADVLDPATLTDPAALVAAIRQHVGDAP